MDKLNHLIRALAAEEDGVQVIEYSLIVAVISIALVVALRGLLGSDVAGFIARVNACLLNSTCS